MIIKNLKLVNFRQFKGEITFDFSTDPQKKATVIMAENTAGKTTLIESFSWIFYGFTKLKTIWNTDLLAECESGKQVRIEGYVTIQHNNIDYVVKRISKKWKNNKTFSNDNDVFEITYTDSEGISQKQAGQDAARLINRIVPKDLFSYFFFKGEQIEKIGKDMSGVNKSVESKEFIKAVRGLLGFSSLYDAMKHLRKISNDYNAEIVNNNKDEKLADITGKIMSAQKAINDATLQLEGIDGQPGLKESARIIEDMKNSKSEEILTFKDAEKMQGRSIQLDKELKLNEIQIDKKKKNIFENFSSRSYAFFSNRLASIAKETLEYEDAVDKGIPNMDSKSLDYILFTRKKCLCGAELIPGTPAYNNIEDFRKYVPPIGIGTEIELMKQYLESCVSNSSNYYNDFKKDREELTRLINQYDKNKEEFDDLNLKIGNIPDVSKLKEEEKQLNSQLIGLNVKIAMAEETIRRNTADVEALEKEKGQYTTVDTHSKKLLKYQAYCDGALGIIERFCRSREIDKKNELQDTINKIFKEIFGSDIQLVLNEKYEISISDENLKALEDLENSTSQDGIMAFSFIAGIIELAGKPKKKEANDDDLGEEIETEPYPLVMDAPSSSFDKKRIKAFSNVLPKIAEQVIIFIKDTDGEYLEEYLGDNVGKKYEIIKHDKYYSSVGGRL